MKKKKATPKSSPKSQQHGNSLAAQRQRVIEALRASRDGLTTIELRERFDVMMPAARIHELRWLFGFNITTVWAHDTNAQGNRHTVARYVLLPGRWKGEAA